jgi:glycosyltransferase involved in cell wall biosynthesis
MRSPNARPGKVKALKILLYTHTFFPKVGGVEDLAHSLATGWTDLGHQVTVVTPIAAERERYATYRIVREPSIANLFELVRCNDIIHANGTSIRLYPLATLLGKPFTWAHHGYQLSCIDGAGWFAGQPAPIRPWASFVHHSKKAGFLKAAVGGLKLLLRRVIAHLVSANIATSKHIAFRQPLPRQRIIYNPIDKHLFASRSLAEAKQNFNNASVTFTFAGRLISEKGVEDLLYAFADVCKQEEDATGGCGFTLKIIGDGPERSHLKSVVKELNLDSRVIWATASGTEFKDLLDRAGICVIPSAWEEPGALIVLELLAMGKPLIVSQFGWLSECAADACLTFPNRDRVLLTKAMHRLQSDPDLQVSLIEKALERSKHFDSLTSLRSYLKLFSELLKIRPDLS